MNTYEILGPKREFLKLLSPKIIESYYTLKI